MGTRYLTVVVNNGKPVIAQAGFFDGDPYDNGLKILKVLRKDKKQHIRTQLHRCTILAEQEYRSFFKDHWLNEEALEKAHPTFWWSDGADLLEMLLEKDGAAECRFSYDFAYDSLQCEWAYVIDYDRQSFEVYKGWSIMPLQPWERFYNDGKAMDGYYPVHLAAAYPLYELPGEEEFKQVAWRNAYNLKVRSVKATFRERKDGGALCTCTQYSLIAELNNERRLATVAYIPQIIIGQEMELLKEDKNLVILTGRVLSHTVDGYLHTVKLRNVTYTFEELENKRK